MTSAAATVPVVPIVFDRTPPNVLSQPGLFSLIRSLADAKTVLGPRAACPVSRLYIHMTVFGSMRTRNFREAVLLIVWQLHKQPTHLTLAV